MKKYKITAALAVLLILGLVISQKSKNTVTPEAASATESISGQTLDASADRQSAPELTDEPSTVESLPEDTPEDPIPALDVLRPLSLTLQTNYLDKWSEASLLCYANFDIIQLSHTESQRLPALSRALNEYRNTLSESAHQAHAENVEMAERNFAESPDNFWGPYTNIITLDIRRADSTVVSILGENKEYCGGIHPVSSHFASTYDSSTGEKLSLDNVVTDISALPELLEPLLREKYPNVSFFDLKGSLNSAAENNGEGFVWTLDSQGVTFYFGQYVLASYAEGLQTVTIPFASRPELFTESYTQIPEAYTMFLSPWYPVSYDLDDDGDMEEITVRAEQDESDMYHTLRITIDKKEFTDEFHAYTFTPYLVHTRNGADYLYIKSVAENDYQRLSVYDLNGDTITLVGHLWGTGFGCSTGENAGAAELPTNPEHFLLETRMDLLSTTSGCRSYHVGEDGMPAADTPYYEVTTDIVLTARQELTADLINPDTGNVLKEHISVPEGSQLKLFRTDNATYMDMLMEDGQICRFQVDSASYPQTVNGISSYDCFDGMIFAG